MWNPNKIGSLDAAIDKQKRFEMTPLLKEAGKRAEDMLRESAIDPHSFSDLYGAEVIARDLEKVERLEKSFSTEKDDLETKQMSDIFEAIVLEQAELNNWLGDNAETIKSSKYDDIINGIDMVAEFGDEKQSYSHLALAVDITFGTTKLADKFARIRKEIVSGQLGSMKYFRSDRNGYRGELSQLPRAVIGVDRETVAQLAGLWSSGHRSSLKTHEVQRLLAEELHQQMQTFLTYARGVKSDKAVAAYERASRISGSILDAKRKLELNDSDRIFRGIRNELSRF